MAKSTKRLSYPYLSTAPATCSLGRGSFGRNSSKIDYGQDPFTAQARNFRLLTEDPLTPYSFKPRDNGKGHLLVPLRQPIYDTECYPGQNNSASELLFIQRPLGMNMCYLQKIKTINETNLTQSGCLATPTEFFLFGFAVEYSGEEIDKQAIRKDGNLEFSHTGNRVYLQIPLTQIPECISELKKPTYNIETKQLDALYYGLILQGELNFWPDPKKIFQFYTSPDQFIHIKSADSFSIRIAHRHGAVKLSAPLTVRIFMDGVMWYVM